MFRDILALVFLLILIGQIMITDGKMVFTMEDDDTGCQYMATWYGTPVTPRLDEEGKPFGCSNLENWQKRETKG